MLDFDEISDESILSFVHSRRQFASAGLAHVYVRRCNEQQTSSSDFSALREDGLDITVEPVSRMSYTFAEGYYDPRDGLYIPERY